MKTIGKYISFKDLMTDVSKFKAYENTKEQARKKGLSWVVPKVELYRIDKADKTKTTDWDGRAGSLHEAFLKAQKGSKEFGIKGWYEISKNVHSHKSGDFVVFNEWSMTVWDKETIVPERLKGNDAVYKRITDRIIAQLEKGTCPWRKPWGAASADGWVGGNVPANFATQKRYRGANFMMLAESADTHSCSWFGTKKQIIEAGGTLMEGADAIEVVFWNFVYVHVNPETKARTKVKPLNPKNFAEGFTDDAGNVYFKDVKKVPYMRYYFVYNCAQTEGLDLSNLATKPPKVVQNIHEPIEAADAIIDNMPQRPRLTHDGGNRAYYNRIADHVRMPKKSQFDTIEEYYNTAFHELAHSTGHDKRLKRESLLKTKVWGDNTYAKEELVAEMTAAFICALCGIDNSTIDNSAAYLSSWLKKLKSNPKWVVQAAGHAQKAADYITNEKVG